MFLLVPTHPGCPGQNPKSRKTVVCVICNVSFAIGKLHQASGNVSIDAIFWIFWCKMKITHSQADTPIIWMDCHLIQTNWCPHLCHPHHFYAGCPSLHNSLNLFWLGTGTKYACLHTQWLGQG